MKICLVATASVLCTLSQFAMADAALTPSDFGALTSAVDFCGQVDPRHKKQLSEVAKKLMKGVSEKSMAQMKHTAEFANGYALIDGVVHELSNANAVQLCTAALGQAEPTRRGPSEPTRGKGPKG